MPPALIVGGAALAGGIAGAMGSKKSSSSQFQNVSGINLAPESELEKLTGQNLQDYYGQLGGMVDQGPGQADVSSAYGATKDYASLLQQMSQTGGLPSASDISSADSIANNLFQAQRLGLQQSFQDSMTQANRQAAAMGRGINDPILQNKLFQEQTRQTQMLNAQQGATSQNLALQLPGQRMQYAGMGADVLAGLATQAFQNRAALLSTGSQLREQERAFRINTGERYSSGSQSSEEKSGGGVGGAISGAIGGLGAGFGIAGGFSQMAGMGKGLSAAAGPMSGTMSGAMSGGYVPMATSMPSVQGYNPLSGFSGASFGQSAAGYGANPFTKTTLLGSR